MKTDPIIEINDEQKQWLLSLSPIEIIDTYCEGTLKILEDHMGMPLQVNVHRQTTTKPHQDLRTSLFMTKIIGELKIIGHFYAREHNILHMKELDYGLKQFLQTLTEQYHNGFFSQEQYINTRKLLNEYILDEIIDHTKTSFLIGHNNIPQYEMLFLLHEFSYRSPVHQNVYNFKGNDIRRTTFGRTELTTMNKYQDYKLNMNNIENQLLDSITNFSYTIKETIDIIFIQKEVQYRLSVLNEIYFNFEHFLSVIIKTFKMTDESIGKKKITKKQEYIARIFNELDINHSIDFVIISKEIMHRCKESSPAYIELFKQENKQNINLIDMFLKIIDMRNSLHSNGASNKDIHEFDIAKIHFNEVKKDQQFQSMAMHQIIALLVIASFSIELIIEKLSTLKEVNGVKVPDIIIDDYVENLRKISHEAV
ncbi:hypothetical protein [Sulfuricurvum sp.]|uniref:hypothetical protein n=1 Tax=Sulfuricurvum sp. TaxID=2025608 RepID=UPI00262FA69F|nr:hypothetical protein [Sulfuricurvum sp.]MDD2265854.1 hypothetical protein [Sulfuricurvum sp.]MDD2784610.1 hypothetical protein [Sulfuricurvum sp.]